MKTIRLLGVCLSLNGLVLLPGNVYAVDLDNLSGAADTLQKSTRILQAGDTAKATVPGSTIGAGVAGFLVQQLGVTQPQAEGGAGALFQLAKSRMSIEDFTTLSGTVPDMQNLLAAAPAAGTGAIGSGIMGDLGGMAGGLGEMSGSLLDLTSSFQQLGLAPEMVQKFIPAVVQYVQETGGNTIANLLQSALTGGL